MGLARLRNFLERHGRIALDTSVFIYQLEAVPRYLALTDPLFTWVQRLESEAITSTITMTEVLVRPYRESNQRLVDEFRGLLNIYPNLTWIAPDLNIADRAARYRAQHRLRTPDAIQAATAVHTGATGFITNDAAFKRVPAFESLVLEDSL